MLQCQVDERIKTKGLGNAHKASNKFPLKAGLPDFTFVIVNFMCQCDWAKGHPWKTGKNLILGM